MSQEEKRKNTNERRVTERRKETLPTDTPDRRVKQQRVQQDRRKKAD